MNSGGTETAARPLDRVETVTLQACTVVGLRQRVAVDEIRAFFTRAIPAVSGELARAGIRPGGAPIAVYRHEQGHHFDVTVGFPVTEAPASTDALVREQLPGGRAVRAVHVGSYDTLPAAYTELSHWFVEHRLTPHDVMWEEYLVGPGAADETAYQTQIVYPLS